MGLLFQYVLETDDFATFADLFQNFLSNYQHGEVTTGDFYRNRGNVTLASNGGKEAGATPFFSAFEVWADTLPVFSLLEDGFGGTWTGGSLCSCGNISCCCHHTQHTACEIVLPPQNPTLRRALTVNSSPKRRLASPQACGRGHRVWLRTALQDVRGGGGGSGSLNHCMDGETPRRWWRAKRPNLAEAPGARRPPASDLPHHEEERHHRGLVEHLGTFFVHFP